MLTIEEVTPVGYESVGELHGDISEALTSLRVHVLEEGNAEDMKVFSEVQSLMISTLMKHIHGYDCTQRYKNLQVKSILIGLDTLSESFPTQVGKIKTLKGYFETYSDNKYKLVPNEEAV